MPDKSMAAQLAPPLSPLYAQSDDELEVATQTIRQHPQTLINWGRSFRVRPQRVYAPCTVRQCLAVVELARREQKELRALGRAHSPGDLPFTKDWILKMDQLNGVIEISHTGLYPTVTLLAGTYISDLHEALHAARPPLGLSNVGSISEQTVGGLISTATHGTGFHHPVISTAVEALTLVCALSREQGGTQLVQCSRQVRPELFNATLCGLGATGIIVRVTMRVEPAFNLRQIEEEVPEDVLLGLQETTTRERVGFAGIDTARIGQLLAKGRRLPVSPYENLQPSRSAAPEQVYPFRSVGVGDSPETLQGLADSWDDETRRTQHRLELVMSSAQHVRFMWFPQVRRCRLLRANRTREVAVRSTMYERTYHRLVGYHLTEFLLFVSRLHSALPQPVARTVHWLTHPPFPSASELQSARLRQFGQDTEWLTLALQSEAGKQTNTMRKDGASLQNGLRTQAIADFRSRKAAFNSTIGSQYDSRASSDAAVHIARPTSAPVPLHPAFPNLTRVERSDRIFNMDCLFPQYTTEWALPFALAAPFLRCLRAWLTEEHASSHGERLHFPVEVRVADSDGVWLSHAYGRKTLYVGLIQFRPYTLPVRYRVLFARFETLMRYFAGRPHWAKAHTCAPSELLVMYPHLKEWKEVREWADPDRTFANPYVKRHLLGEIGPHVDSRTFKSRI